MGSKRRTVLRLLGLGTVLGTTGVAGRELLREQDAAVTATQQSQESTESQETETESAPPALAARTTDVMDELSWFATEYDDAVRAYRDAARAILTTLSTQGETIQLSESDVRRLDGRIDQPRIDEGWPYDIWWEKGERRWRYVDIDWQRPHDDVADETPLPDSAMTELRDVTDAFVTAFEAQIDPHFPGLKQERAFAANTINSIKRFNDRDDRAMVVAGLVRLYQHYNAIDSAAHVETTLSDDPIRNRLAGYLKSPTSDGTPPLFGVDYRRGRTEPFTAYVYGDAVQERRRSELYEGIPLESIDGSTGGNGGLRLQNVLGALKNDTDRVDRCFVLVSKWDRPSDSYYTDVLPSQSIFVQRYEDATAASNARAALLGRDGITPNNGTFPIDDGDQWTTIQFPFRGAPWNAALRQAGPHVLVAGVARQPFRHRNSNWAEPLELSWLRGED